MKVNYSLIVVYNHCTVDMQSLSMVKFELCSSHFCQKDTIPVGKYQFKGFTFSSFVL